MIEGCHESFRRGAQFITAFGTGRGSGRENASAIHFGLGYSSGSGGASTRRRAAWTATAPNAAVPETWGYDAGKKVKGPKRPLLANTLGLLLAATAASMQDRAHYLAHPLLPRSADRRHQQQGTQVAARTALLPLLGSR